MSKVDFSLVLACYNEGPTFTQSLDKIFNVLRDYKKSWEVIFVEDKSKDDTKQRLLGYIKTVKGCRVVLHSQNMGRGKSVSDGLVKAKGAVCGFMDVDCEISPSYIPLFVSEVESGHDMAIATRYYEKSAKSIVRVVASRGYVIFSKLVLGMPLKDTEAGFKFFNRKKILPILKKTKDNGWFWDTEICARAYLAGLKITELPVLFVKRSDKKSTVNVIRDSLDYAKKLLAFKKEYKILESKQNG